MANYAFKDLGARKAAIIQDVNQDYSIGLSKYFMDAFKELTGDPDSIVEISSYNTGNANFQHNLPMLKVKIQM